MPRPRDLLAAAVLAALLALPARAEGPGPDSPGLYRDHCAQCHGGDRLGAIGPALLPESLARLKKAEAAQVIAHGRPATQMPGFAETLGGAEIAALAAYIYRPLAATPSWGLEEIRASRVVHADPVSLPGGPVHEADPLNLFVVVESGDHHVTILDGDRFEPLARFPTRFALHGGPKFTPDGRFVFFMSRDGWVSKYDLHGLRLVAEVRAGINSRNIAISHDGRVVAVANYLPHTLALLDAGDLAPLAVLPALDLRGRRSSRVSAVYQAAPRTSFVVALKDIPELWEVSYAENPPPSYPGLVHSHEKGMMEALPSREGRFPIRRTELGQPLDDFFFTPSYRQLVGSARDGGKAVVVHLDVRREIASLPLPGLPHLGSGISWLRDGRRVMATPHLKDGRISILDVADWSVVATVQTLGPGFFLRSHERNRYAWADNFLSPGHRDTLQLIDKQTLAVAAELRPAPGKTAAHVEFTRDGRHALVSIWEMDGALVVYDAETLQEVKRLPMVKPSGKYNVYNKIMLSEGTSH